MVKPQLLLTTTLLPLLALTSSPVTAIPVENSPATAFSKQWSHRSDSPSTPERWDRDYTVRERPQFRRRSSSNGSGDNIRLTRRNSDISDSENSSTDSNSTDEETASASNSSSPTPTFTLHQFKDGEVQHELSSVIDGNFNSSFVSLFECAQSVSAAVW